MKDTICGCKNNNCEYCIIDKENSLNIFKWRNNDPRELTDKRNNIVILRPSLLGHNLMEAGIGQAECKEGYNIFTSFNNYPLINADDKWNIDWKWILMPQNNRKE